MQYFQRLVLLFLFSTTCHCFAQQLIFKTYGMNDGLVHNAVRKIYQDSQGFLWIGTWEGLSKYDGHKFTNYSGVSGLSNDFINDIFETKDGSIYITCNDGGIYRISNNGLPKKINTSNTIINRLVALANGKTIALTDHNGIYEFRDEKLWKPVQPGGSNDYYNLSAISDSLFLFQSDFSLQLVNSQYKLVSQQKESTPLYAECGMMKDSKDRLWIGTHAGLKLVQLTQDKDTIRFISLPPAFNHPFLQNSWIRAILEDAEGNLWFGTSQGLLKIGTNGLQQLLTEKNGLPSNDINCIYQDREKNIWVGGSRGVARLVTSTSISIFRTEDGLASNAIYHVLPLANGDVLTKSATGTQLYKGSSATFEPAPKNIYSNAKDGPYSLANEGIAYRYLIFQQRPYHFTYFSPNPIGEYYAYKDSAGNYFVHSFSGVMMSRDLKEWQIALCSLDTRTTMLDTKGALWAGTRDSGLFRISYQYNNRTPQVKEQKHFLPGISIRSLYEDSKGNIWVGSRYHGVFCMEKDGKILHQFNQKSGLTSNRSTSIAEDKNGAIWLSFYSGLDKLIPQNNSYRVFNFSRFHNFFTNIQAMAFDNVHSLWLATTQGLVNINEKETGNTSPLKTIITSAVLGDSVYLNAVTNKINLSYLQNRVHFEYAAPSFINEKQMMYSYRLLGVQSEEWSPPLHEHSVSFANLRPGNYRFEVKALGWNNQWSQSSSFLFSISPPFWQNAWFISFAVLLVAASVFLGVRKRIKQIRRNAELKHKLAEAEMMALRSQMNPHFIFNCLNAIDNMIQTNQKEKATTYLNRFAKLIRGILDSSKNNLVPIHKDVETLKLYLELEQFRCSNQFNYSLDIEPALLDGDYKIPPLIVQPFLENAIHHGLMNKDSGNRCLEVSVKLIKDFIKYTIKDNGVGRAAANELKLTNKPEHQSYGIQISTDRIKMHNNPGPSQGVVITDLYNNEKPAGTLIEMFVKADN